MVDVDVLADKVAERLAPLLAAREPQGLLSPKQLGERLGVSERTVRQMLAEGVIPSIKVEGARRIAPEAVEAYLADREREAQAA